MLDAPPVLLSFMSFNSVFRWLVHRKKHHIGSLNLNIFRYKRNARRVSKAYRDRPMTPLQTAIYWIEYVLRHEGAYHLRSPARNMPWYQYHNYDVYLLLHLIVLAVVYTLYKSLRGLANCLMGLCCSKSKPKNPSTKVKKS